MKLTFTKKNKGKKQRITVEVPSLVLTKNKDIIFIELAGPTSAVQAVLARMRHIGGKVKRDDYMYLGMTIPLGGYAQSLRVMSGKYLDEKLDNNVLVYHSGASISKRKYFFGGDSDNKSPFFIDAFRINVTGIPATPDMADLLWKYGIAEGLVIPLESYGEIENVWTLNTMDHAWANIMPSIIEERRQWQD